MMQRLNQGRMRGRKHIIAVSFYPKTCVPVSDSVSKPDALPSLPSLFNLFSAFCARQATDFRGRDGCGTLKTRIPLYFLLFRPISDFFAPAGKQKRPQDTLNCILEPLFYD